MWLARLKKAVILALIVGGVSAATIGAFRGLPFLASAERWIADYRIATLLAPEPQSEDIVVVAITEETLELFPYRSPVDRKFVADLLKTLEQRGVRGILVDILFDQPTEDEKDDYLKETLDAIKVPLVISYGRQENFLTDEQVEFLDDFVKPEQRGFADLLDDGFDAVVREIYPGRKLPDETFLPGVAPALDKKLGVAPPETVIALAYHGRPNVETPAFKTFPAHAVGFLPPEWLKGKIALVGADVSYTIGFSDRHRTPFAAAPGGERRAGVIPGIEVHAHALSQLLDGRRAPNLEARGNWALIAAFALFGMALGLIEMHVALRIGAAAVALPLLWIGGFMAFRYEGFMVPLLQPSLALGLSMWMTDAYTGRQERQQKKFISQVFSKYVSGDLLDEIIKDPKILSMDATRREMSLLFTDVAGFTTISEKMEPADLANLLNEYLDGACKEVFRYGGTVNQFTGDAIYAMFNAPREQPDHAQRALNCAIAIDNFSQGFVKEKAAIGVEFGKTRIGVHTALASVGNFGSRERFEYKALGDAVNTASRLEGLNKYFGTHLLISGGCAQYCQDQPMRPLGHVVVKGREHPIEVMEPLSAERDQSEFIARYRAAFAALDRGEAAAKDMFEALHRENPEDGPTAFHLERIQAGQVTARVVMDDK